MATRLAETVASSRPEFTNMVGSAAPFQVTTVLALNPEPKTESVNDGAPVVIEFGVMKSRDSEDGVMMKDAMFDAPD
jgi:hypothetical protein